MLQELKEDGKKLINQEKLELEKKKEESSIIEFKKNSLEREIARLENVLIAIQKNRLKVEEQNAKLDELTIEREQEIKVIGEKITQKEGEIKKSESVYIELRKNIDEIVNTAIGF